ncbi:hypothetical protein D3C80_1676150 [compost metagenome]
MVGAFDWLRAGNGRGKIPARADQQKLKIIKAPIASSSLFAGINLLPAPEAFVGITPTLQNLDAVGEIRHPYEQRRTDSTRATKRHDVVEIHDRIMVFGAFLATGHLRERFETPRRVDVNNRVCPALILTYALPPRRRALA